MYQLTKRRKKTVKTPKGKKMKKQHYAGREKGGQDGGKRGEKSLILGKQEVELMRGEKASRTEGS